MLDFRMMMVSEKTKELEKSMFWGSVFWMGFLSLAVRKLGFASQKSELFLMLNFTMMMVCRRNQGFGVLGFLSLAVRKLGFASQKSDHFLMFNF